MINLSVSHGLNMKEHGVFDEIFSALSQNHWSILYITISSIVTNEENIHLLRIYIKLKCIFLILKQDKREVSFCKLPKDDVHILLKKTTTIKLSTTGRTLK